MQIAAVIFDLDGVIVSTDEYHYLAWKAIADLESIPFTKEDNEKLRGVSRMDSLEIILKKSKKPYTEDEKLLLASIKNNIYKNLLERLTPKDILVGVTSWLDFLEGLNIKTVIGSSSKNARLILSKVNMLDAFDEIVDGNEISRSKPDPEVFLLAAKKLNSVPEECLVVEDAVAGIDAACAAGMQSMGVGFASNYDKSTYRYLSLGHIEPNDFFRSEYVEA